MQFKPYPKTEINLHKIKNEVVQDWVVADSQKELWDRGKKDINDDSDILYSGEGLWMELMLEMRGV